MIHDQLRARRSKKRKKPRERRPRGLCKLCLRMRLLCRSHIIPEACYTNHIIDPVLGHALELGRGQDTPRRKQTGQWEHLLCEGCEAHLNELCEKYFERVWYKENVLPDAPPRTEVVLQGLDYVKFRLFHLSVLWRLSVSQKAPLFVDVKLAARHEENIRQMLWRGHADYVSTYAFTAVCLTLEDRVFHAISDGQTLRPHGGVQVYVVMYGGCVWTFYIGDSVPPDVRPMALQRNGTMRIRVEDVGTYFGVSSTRRRGRVK